VVWDWERKRSNKRRRTNHIGRDSMRKIIQIQLDRVVDGLDLYLALCDDGTVWQQDNYDKTWTQFQPIPQDEVESK
jgi:hypothetical protein